MKKILVVGPHPDDELLGCGGTILRRVKEGCVIGWLLLTSLQHDKGWSEQRITQRNFEIQKVLQGLRINTDDFYSLGFPTAELDQIPMSTLVESVSNVFNEFKPNEVLLPHPGDAHSDHRIAFEAACACTKCFRYPSVNRVMTYETLSETDFGLNPVEHPFRPNLFVNITDYLDEKLELLKIYTSEIGDHPFPRSLDSIHALSLLRGSQISVQAAEAFQVLKHIE